MIIIETHIETHIDHMKGLIDSEFWFVLHSWEMDHWNLAKKVAAKNIYSMSVVGNSVYFLGPNLNMS